MGLPEKESSFLDLSYTLKPGYIGIKTQKDFNNMVSNSNNKYILLSNITLNSRFPSRSFNSTLLGNNFTIYTKTNIFDEIGTNGLVSDLFVEADNIKLSGENVYGILAISNDGKVNRVNLSGGLEYLSNWGQIGGLVGQNNGLIAYCNSRLTINAFINVVQPFIGGGVGGINCVDHGVYIIKNAEKK